jgi:hypothetical protein
MSPKSCGCHFSLGSPIGSVGVLPVGRLKMYSERGKSTAWVIWASRRADGDANFGLHRHSDEILTHPNDLPATREEPK